MSVASDPLEAALAWAERAPRSEIFEHRLFARQVLDTLEREQRWAELIAFARATQGAMAHGRRWDAWQHVLERALHAARVSGDRSAEAWARHQLGTRALLLDDLSEAWPELHRSLELREQLGETAGVDVTRHNLRLLPLALAGLMTVLTVFVGAAALLIPTIDPGDLPKARLGGPILDISSEVIDLASGATEAQVELTNRGAIAFDGLPTIESDVVALQWTDGCEALAVDATCRLLLDVGGVGDQPVVVRLCYPDQPVGGCATNPGESDFGILLRRNES